METLVGAVIGGVALLGAAVLGWGLNELSATNRRKHDAGQRRIDDRRHVYAAYLTAAREMTESYVEYRGGPMGREEFRRLKLNYTSAKAEMEMVASPEVMEAAKVLHEEVRRYNEEVNDVMDRVAAGEKPDVTFQLPDIEPYWRAVRRDLGIEGA